MRRPSGLLRYFSCGKSMINSGARVGLRCYVVERCRAKCSVTFAKVQYLREKLNKPESKSEPSLYSHSAEVFVKHVSGD